MIDQQFLKEYDSEKNTSWKENYIDYIGLCNKITSILENYNNKNQNILKENHNEEESDEKNIKIELIPPPKKSQNNIIKEEDEDNGLENNLRPINIKNKDEIFKKQTKVFISLLDNEIKKMHIFYTKKETSLFEGVSSQISIFNNNKKTKKKNQNYKIISELAYLIQLTTTLIFYIYSNIKALKKILNTYDQNIMEISYEYLKKHFSKSNGNFVYILNFKILDKCKTAIQGLFELVKADLNKTKFFKKNKNLEEKFEKECEDIERHVEDIEEIHEKIFDELTEWEKQLNLSLGLPTSSYHSVFKNTSFIGDLVPLSIKKSKTIHIKPKNKENNIILDNDDQCIKKGNISSIFSDFSVAKENNDDNDNKGKELFEKNKESDEDNDSFGRESSQLFKNSDFFSFETRFLLKREGIRNLKILYSLIFFFSFSDGYLIPNIVNIINKIDFDIIFINFNKYKIGLYGIIISIPALGNLISKVILKYFLDKKFKIILILSVFCLLLYYAFLIAELRFKYFFLFIIGRFLFGFSILSHISKIYVEYYIPLTTQIKTNRRHTIYFNLGYFCGFLLNSLYSIDKNFEVEQYYINIIIGFNKLPIFIIIIIICLVFTLIIFVVIIRFFYEPNKYSLIRETVIQMNSNHKLSNAYLIENTKKKEKEALDNIYLDENSSALLTLSGKLDQFLEHDLDKNYYTIIFLF